MTKNAPASVLDSVHAVGNSLSHRPVGLSAIVRYAQLASLSLD
jgi:hypothetical protein